MCYAHVGVCTFVVVNALCHCVLQRVSWVRGCEWHLPTGLLKIRRGDEEEETGMMDEEPAPTASPAGSIRAIDRGTVHQICSGQVVLTLATAVKELVENSLDAGATSIEVRLKEHGAEVVEVSDNGSGVDEDNFQGLTLKHHTSKLQVFSDLASVETFGFRGEALSSLCALSELSVVTCARAASVGTRLVFDREGHVAQRCAVARTPGTTVTLAHLFSCLPVRHKEFLRSLKKEFSKMVHVLQAYCVMAAGVRIACSNQSGAGGKRSVVLATAGAPTVRENIAAVFGAKQLQTLLPLQQSTPSPELYEEFGLHTGELATTFQLSGFVSRCDHGAGRSSADRQFLFVNGRPCDLAKVSKLVNEVYHSYNRHQYPFLVLNIVSSTDLVDVNVTPDKRLVLLQEERLLLAVVKATLTSLYEPTLNQLPINTTPRAGRPVSSAPRSTGGGPDRPPKALDAGKARAFSGLGRAFGFRPSLGFGRGSSDAAQPSPTSPEDCGSFSQEDCGKEAPGDGSQSDAGAQEEEAAAEGSVDDGSTPLLRCDSPRIGGCGEIGGAARGEDQCLGAVSVEKVEKEVRGGSPRIPSVPASTSVGLGVLDRFHRTPCRTQRPGSVVSAPLSSGTPKRRRDIMATVQLGGPAERNRKVRTEEEAEEEATAQAEGPGRTVEAVLTAPADGACTVDVAMRVVRREVPVPFSLTRLRARRATGGTDSPTGAVDPPGGCRFRAKISPSDNRAAEEELQKKFHKHMFAHMEVVGQFNLGFVVARLGPDLFIVDQHASDEKYNYETLRRDSATLHGQRLIAPLKLPLTAVGELVLMENLDIFRKNGFDFIIDEQAPATERVRLTTLPVQRGWMFGVSDVEELVFLLSDRPGVMCRPSRVQQMLASKACRKSVMIGTALNATEMRRLLLHMGEMEQPWSCPHGRPTMRHLINLDLLTGPGGRDGPQLQQQQRRHHQHAAAPSAVGPSDGQENADI
ncbi:mismatch repair endonuclease PMS2 isoform X1 [Lampetra planeri]